MASFKIIVKNVEHELTKKEYDEFCDYADEITALKEMYGLSDADEKKAHENLRIYVLSKKRFFKTKRSIFPKFDVMFNLNLK